MKILIVEDDPEISALVREGLDEAGYTTMVSRDGDRGLKLALSDTFSLVILDVMLPSMNGFDICRELRQRSRNVPVLMLTAKDAIPDRVGGLEAGADDYLVKPFDFNELLARVRALLRRDHTIKQSVIQVDDLVVDTSSKVVKRNDKEIALTGREYKLLEALITHTGQILSRQAIQERVWLDEHSVSNTVDVFIKNLRKKIDDGAETKLIHTVHGLGYTLRTEGPSG